MLIVLSKLPRPRVNTMANHNSKHTTKTIKAIINEYLEELQRYVNSKVNRYSQLQMVIYQPEPFQKTATLKIKRFLYY